MNKVISDKKNRVSCLILCIILLIAYSPAWLSHYGFSDDWFYLHASNTDPFSILKWDILSGRPLYGAIRYLFSFFTHDLQSLAYLRALSLCSLIILGCYILRFLAQREILNNPYQRLTFVSLLCLLPAFQVFVAWTVCFPYALAVILAGMSYSALAQQKNSHFRILLSAIYLTLSFAIYQPAAMSFLFFMLLEQVVSKNSLNYRIVIKSILMLGFGMFMALLLAKVLPSLLFHEVLARTNITFEPVKKIVWFVREPLKNTICNFDLGRSVVATIISVALIATGIYSMKRTDKYKPHLFIAVLIAAGLPNLLVSESWAAYRTVVAISLLTTSAFIIGLFFTFAKLRIEKIASTICIVLAVFLCMKNIQKGFSTPQQTEYALLKNYLLKEVPATFNGQLYYRLESDDLPRIAKSVKYDEFGSLSLGMPWTFAGMAEAIRKETSMHFTLPVNTVINDGNPCTTNCIIIDASKVLASADGKQQ